MRERAPASRHRGAWRIGGLIGAAVFSVVCWGLAIQGIRAVIGFASAPPQIEAASTVESPREP